MVIIDPFTNMLHFSRTFIEAGASAMRSIREITRKSSEVLRTGITKIPAWVFPLIFGALLDHGAKAYLKPALSVEVAYSDAVTMPVLDSPTRFIAALVDYFPTGQAQIVAPRSLTFDSENDFVRVPNGSLTIVKVLLTNAGHATAKHIRAGLGLPIEWEIAVSPNVEVTSEKTVRPVANYPAYRLVEISQLAAGETAVLTISGPCGCSSSERVHVSENGKVFLPTQASTDGFAPLLFVTDEEDSFTGETPISMKLALEQEKLYLPAMSVGFWAEGLKVKEGVSPAIKPLERLTIEIEKAGKNGQTTRVTLTTEHPVQVD
jgi:hypothetical protein